MKNYRIVDTCLNCHYSDDIGGCEGEHLVCLWAYENSEPLPDNNDIHPNGYCDNHKKEWL